LCECRHFDIWRPKTMPKRATRKIAFVSSCLPRRCGIATFCNDLTKNISASAGDAFDPLMVAMVSSHDHQYGDPVKFGKV
ncbi:MAG: hypothetical protein ACYTBY_07775, partial [Planctomycetota bacterium]